MTPHRKGSPTPQCPAALSGQFVLDSTRVIRSVTSRLSDAAIVSRETHVLTRPVRGRLTRRICRRRLLPRQPSTNGWRQRRPGKRLKSRSVVIHSFPDSIASAARYASKTRLPFAPAARQSRSKVGQWRGPGATITAFGCARSASTNASACSVGAGGSNTRGCVATRTTPARTSSDRPNGSSETTADSSQAR